MQFHNSLYSLSFRFVGVVPINRDDLPDMKCLDALTDFQLMNRLILSTIDHYSLTTNKKNRHLSAFSLSGQGDLNSRPRDPQSRALTGLRHAPNKNLPNNNRAQFIPTCGTTPRFIFVKAPSWIPTPA